MDCSKCERHGDRGETCEECIAQQIKRLADVAEWWKGHTEDGERQWKQVFDAASDPERMRAQMSLQQQMLDAIERSAAQKPSDRARLAKELHDRLEGIAKALEESPGPCRRCGLPATAWFPSLVDPRRVACCSSCTQLAHRHAMQGRQMKSVDEYADAGLAFLKVRPDGNAPVPSPAPKCIRCGLPATRRFPPDYVQGLGSHRARLDCCEGCSTHAVNLAVSGPLGFGFDSAKGERWLRENAASPAPVPTTGRDVTPEDLGLPPGTDLPPPIDLPPPELKLRPCVRCGATTQLWSVCSGDGQVVRACEPCYDEAMRRSNEAGSNPRVGYDWLVKKEEKPHAL